MDSRSSLLILGLGNLLCRDDGLGAFVAQEIAGTRVIPDGVQRAGRGHARPRAPPLPRRRRARDPRRRDRDRRCRRARFVRLEGDEVGPAVAARLSVHQVGVSDLIEAARWRDRIPPTLVLLGLVPETTELGVGLSPAVLAGMPALVERVCEEAARLGFRLLMKAGDEPTTARRDGDPADRVGLRLLQPAG